jgi:[acyl-carrier-protein] S-malonyltransferase
MRVAIGAATAMARALVFPGQGSQAIGMGRELAAAFPVARETLEEVDDALNQNLARLMAEGPEAELTLTENAQPALMAVSLAALRVLEAECGLDVSKSCQIVAGHSLGEYSALAAARAFGVAAAARLLKARGRAMQEAVPKGEGAMAALIGADLDKAREVADLAAEGEVCDVANDNAPGQVVVSGNKSAVERAIAISKDRGIRRGMLLSVSAPFHCRLMAPAAEVMKKELAGVDLRRPLVPLIANVTAAAVEEPDEIRSLLVRQVTAMVRWRESVIAMRAGGIDTVVELGSGKVLAGLVKRIDPDISASSVGTPADVEAFAKAL